MHVWGYKTDEKKHSRKERRMHNKIHCLRTSRAILAGLLTNVLLLLGMPKCALAEAGDVITESTNVTGGVTQTTTVYVGG